jgi:phenylalanyl-tRNA synthetase beta chain
MKISNSWLQKYLKVDLSIEKISELLTDIGLEVEGVYKYETVKGGLEGIIIGEILTKTKHPDADRLNLTTVDIGYEEPLQIVCGAPNLKVGQKVPVATVGTLLYSGDDSFKIKRSKIRGQISNGMICGQDEIGLGPTTDGIMVLEADAKIGLTGSEYFNVESDTVFEIGLTPNRTDAMSHIGVARDLKAVLNYKGHNLTMCIPSVDDFKVDNNNLNINVKVISSDLCPRYSGLTISDISVKESPEWLKNKILAIGIYPINNVVDVTNYVLHEIGQPLHAFDASKITDNKIIVKTLKKDSLFISLDEKERKLSDSDLMICNSNEPMCIAGVFGGLDSSVTTSTQNIFLESAYFNPISIRKSAKYHNLNTDASFRYERGCDPNITVYALKRAALLIKELCGGTISSEIIDYYPNQISDHSILFSYSSMNNLIGDKINKNVVKNILTDLEIKIVNEENDVLSLLVPPYRVDVTREVDVIEEVLRIYGYNTVKISNKLNTSITSIDRIDSFSLKTIVSNLLSSNGYNEIMNNSLTKEAYDNLILDIDPNQNVKIINPLSADLNTLRRTLLFSVLESLEYNLNRKNSNIKFYEFGKTYFMDKEYVENQHLLLMVTGNRHAENWNSQNTKVDFFYLKEIVHLILNRFGIKNLKSEKINTYGFEDGLMYKYKKKRLVCFGEVTKDLSNKFGIKSDVYIADFNWDLIVDLVKNQKITYTPVNKYPKVRRDLSLLIDNNISFDELEKIAKGINNVVLKSINLFDVYNGDKLPKDKKSYALSFIFEDYTKTLTDKYIDGIMKKLIKEYVSAIGAEIR